MSVLNQQSYIEFISQNPKFRKYDESRTALGVNPGKLAMLFDGDTHVASVVFIDHLYLDGREIYIPAFDKKICDGDSLKARMDTHAFIEKEVATKLGYVSLKSGYTDVYPQCPMYWDHNEKDLILFCSKEAEKAPIKSAPPEKKEVQLGFF
jgi:hypothetical protein